MRHVDDHPLVHAVADQVGLVACLDPEAERASLDPGQFGSAARLFVGKAFQPAASLKALTYFKDGDLGKLSGADRSTLIKAAKSVRALPRIALRSKKLAPSRIY